MVDPLVGSSSEVTKQGCYEGQKVNLNLNTDEALPSAAHPKLAGLGSSGCEGLGFECVLH